MPIDQTDPTAEDPTVPVQTECGKTGSEGAEVGIGLVFSSLIHSYMASHLIG